MVYVDSSVLLRILGRQPRALAGWKSLSGPLSSALIEVEVPRALDGLRQAGELDEAAAAAAAQEGRHALRTFHLMEVDAAVRLRAAGPFAVRLRTLDAIHLASALLWREHQPQADFAFATHDARLAHAAQAHGLSVLGWPE